MAPPEEAKTVTRLFARQLEIALDHQLDQLLERRPRGPAQRLAGLGRIALQVVDFRRPEVTGVELQEIAVIEADVAERLFAQLADRMALSGGDDEIVGFVLLHCQPHRLDEVLGVAPVAAGLEVAEEQLLLQTHLDAAGRAGALVPDERRAATRGVRSARR